MRKYRLLYSHRHTLKSINKNTSATQILTLLCLSLTFSAPMIDCQLHQILQLSFPIHNIIKPLDMLHLLTSSSNPDKQCLLLSLPTNRLCTSTDSLSATKNTNTADIQKILLNISTPLTSTQSRPLQSAYTNT